MGKFKYEKYDYHNFLKKKVHIRYVITDREYNTRINLFHETEEGIIKDYISILKHNVSVEYKELKNFKIELEGEIIFPHKTYKFNETSN